MLEKNKIYCMDCIKGMKQMEDNSVDAIVTDPPYGLEFMGKEWDKFDSKTMGKKLMAKRDAKKDSSIGRKNDPYIGARVDKYIGGNQLQMFCKGWATQCLRVLKPGGHLLSFSGTRTYHRMVCGIEDAGFEIRDMIEWVYGSGFPKSLNIGKAVDKIQGNEREDLGIKSSYRPNSGPQQDKEWFQDRSSGRLTKGTSEWEGWGSNLKPSHEPIAFCRKPLGKGLTIAENVLKYGTGGINIDACRVEADIKNDINYRPNAKNHKGHGSSFSIQGDGQRSSDDLPDDGFHNSLGRFPANLILSDSEEVRECFPETKGDNRTSKPTYDKGMWGNAKSVESTALYSDSGNASRFFKSIIYTAKASKSERNDGLDRFEEQTIDDGREVVSDRPHQRGATQRKNIHPTVKPVDLIEYLIKLVSRQDALILDPFIGSGTTAIACRQLSRNFIGFEKEKEYVDIANARIKKHMEQKKLFEVM